MEISTRFWLLAAIVLAVVALGLAPNAANGALPQPVNPGALSAAVTQRPAPGPDADKKVDAFIAQLERDGFTVQDGRLAVAPLLNYCCQQDAIIDCSYFNAASPYMAAFLPIAPGQTTVEWPDMTLPEYPDLHIGFRLRPDEAIVFVGLTPPSMRYYGFQTYRWLTVVENDGVKSRVRQWNNFGDQTNQLTINSAGTPNGTQGNPFNSMTIRITTADRGIDARVRQAAQRAGYAPPIINTEPVPQSVVRMGLDQDADRFTWLLRTALPDNPDELATYKANPPVRILRVTPKTDAPVWPAMSADPFPVPDFRIHGTGQTEFGLLPVVQDLRRAILAEYSDLQATELTSAQWLFYGLHHLDIADDGIAPSTDALYLKTVDTFGTLSDDPDEFIIVYGVNHQKTGKAMYMNVSMYGETKHVTWGSVDDRKLVGTAVAFLQGHPDADRLYAVKFARHCDQDEANCFEVPYGCCDPEEGEDCRGAEVGCPGLKANEEGVIAWRSYLDPKAKTGPDPAEVLFDRAIKFSPKP